MDQGPRAALKINQLAKDAALKIKTKPTYDKCPVLFAKREIRRDALGEWNQRYQSETVAVVTKVFFPDAVRAHKTIRQMESKATHTQILTGHGGFGEYPHRFGCKADPYVPAIRTRKSRSCT